MSGLVRRIGSALWTAVAGWLDRRRRWYRLWPDWFALAVLLGVRNRLRERNLIGTSLGLPAEGARRSRSVGVPACRRSPDGTFNDLEFPTMGTAGTPFGRNMLMNLGAEDPNLLGPNPRLVSERLLARQPSPDGGPGIMTRADPLNLLAAAWIQFMVHDWFSHGPTQDPRSQANPIEVPLDSGDPWPRRPMLVPRTARDHTRPPCSARTPRTFLNTVTHWWDGSQLYGSDFGTQWNLRAHKDGKLAMGVGLLPQDPDPAKPEGTELAGFTDNWWMGLSLLHTLFALEHNRICDVLAQRYRHWSDEDLFAHARLVTVALMAKIHTVEWTPAILANSIVARGMRGNWQGLEGEGGIYKWLGRLGGRETRYGIPGSSTDHHGVPYAITEEFVSVYRMHPLLPDRLEFYAVDKGQVATASLLDVAFERSRQFLAAQNLGMDDVVYSFGRMAAGALTLHNYPDTLRNLTLPNTVTLDLAAVDILRDRERGVPRYNDFRERVHLPRVGSFDELVGDRPERAQWARELQEVYGNVDAVDLMVGLFAEAPPPGFGLSDTAFRIFILMASRRLKSDRFFTDDFREEVYTPEGMALIKTSGMKEVILRNLDQDGALRSILEDVENVFWQWDTPGNSRAARASAAEAAG